MKTTIKELKENYQMLIPAAIVAAFILTTLTLAYIEQIRSLI